MNPLNNKLGFTLFVLGIIVIAISTIAIQNIVNSVLDGMIYFLLMFSACMEFGVGLIMVFMGTEI